MPLPKSQTHSQMPKKWMGLSEVVEQRKPYWAQKLNKMFTINLNPEDAKKIILARAKLRVKLQL